MRARRTMTRIHVWLGWLIGVPLLFWTVSGLWMASRPIDEVRGTALRAKPLAMERPEVLAWPPATTRPATNMTLLRQDGETLWVVAYADGGFARFSARDGKPLATIDAAAAARLAAENYAGKARPLGASYFTADTNPIDLRRQRPAWQVRYDDSTHLYIDAESGQFLAIRTAQWRLYDWMWGLHIMDLKGREDTSHAILILFAALAAGGTILALILLPIASRRRRGG